MHSKAAPDELENYMSDASNMSGGSASRVYFPEDEAEVAEILSEANAEGTAVTVSGARTGTVGGAVPFGGYIISMERMNKIKSIDRQTLTAVVEPGVVLGDFQKAVEAEGMFYPPDPTEWSCQIGGTVATNASGARSFKYGATREFVKRLRVVLANGDKLELACGDIASPIAMWPTTESLATIQIAVPTYERPNVRKNVSGYYTASPLDAIDIVIGSEGTLGVITEIEMTLLPRPEAVFSGIVFFEREHDLIDFVNFAKWESFYMREEVGKPGLLSNVIRKHGINATLLEYFDDRALKFISEKFPETPSGMAGAIFFEEETSSENEDAVFEAWNLLLEKHNAKIDSSWFATNDHDREKMRAFRHALPVSVNEFITRHKQRKVGTDMAVPDENFYDFLRFYKDILNTSGIDYVIFGHIGDCHLHANMLPKNAEEAEKSRYIYGRCVAEAIMLGGTVSAEHGIGKLKRKYLSAMMGERYLNEMADLKRAFDPNGILGRGNIFDESYL